MESRYESLRNEAAKWGHDLSDVPDEQIERGLAMLAASGISAATGMRRFGSVVAETGSAYARLVRGLDDEQVALLDEVEASLRQDERDGA